MAKPDPQISSSVRSGSAARNSACQAGLPRDTARLAAPVRHTLKSQIQSKPRRARSSRGAASTEAGGAGRHGPARGARPPQAQEPDPVEAATREIIEGGVIDSGEGDRRSGLL